MYVLFLVCFWLKTTDHYQVLYDSASWMRCNINSDREYEIHNLLDRMEDLRKDIYLSVLVPVLKV
jgi:hypothetical protein